MDQATKVAINAKFSLIAVAYSAGAVLLLYVKDYVGKHPCHQGLLLRAEIGLV